MRRTLVPIILAAALLTGCATAPTPSESSQEIQSLVDDNLDLLFATEFPVGSKEEAVAAAEKAWRQGDIEKAQFYLVRALQFDRTDAALLARVGQLHILSSNDRLAARAYALALHHDPDNVDALEGMGLIYFRNEREDLAVESLEAAVSKDDRRWQAYNALGVIADRRADFEQADHLYGRALEIRPESDSVLINRGYSRYLRGMYYESALDFYEVATRSDSFRGWMNLGMVYAKQGRYKIARECYEEVLEPPMAYNEVGAIAMQNGDMQVARTYLEEAVRLSPRYFASAEKNLAELRVAAASK